jgi:hypothetical protein
MTPQPSRAPSNDDIARFLKQCAGAAAGFVAFVSVFQTFV